MLEDIANLGSPDPKVGKAAALNIVQHISQNKTELAYLVKRLVNGLESTKIQTRTGCYTTLSVLLHLQKVDPLDLFDLMQKALITNKQSTKKERRLIYIARILCTGSILKSIPVANLTKQENLVKNILHEVVDLCLKKSGYFQLATPYLTHLLTDNTLTQQVFDQVVWPEIAGLFDSLTGSVRKKKKKDGDEEDEEEMDAVNLACCVQLGLACKNGAYRSEFECLDDVGKIAKALLVCKLQFEDVFLKSLFKSIKDSKPELESFWTTFLDGIKPTQFDLLCSSVEKAVEEQVPLSCVISKRLVRLLLGVFNSDPEFHSKSERTIRLLLKWNDKDGKSVMKKKERKQAIACLFGGEAPNLLHEYKRVSAAVREFIFRRKDKDLEYLTNVIFDNLEDSGSLGVRMAIVYLNVLGRVGLSKGCGDECLLKIGKKLLLVGIGKERVNIEKKGDGDLDESYEIIRNAAVENFKSIMSGCYNVTFIELMWEFVSGEVKELSSKDETIRVFKDARKVIKKLECVHFKSLVICYCLRVLVDEREVVSTAVDGAREVIQIGKGVGGGDSAVEVVRFVVGRVVKDVSPCVFVDGVFGRLMIEGRVGEEVVQELAASIEVGDGGEGDGDDEGDSSDSGSEYDDDEPVGKVPKLEVGELGKNLGGGEGSDSEESINLEDACEEDLKDMDGALAKVFAVKRIAKDEENSVLRGLMRSLRLIEAYVQRNIKCMGVGAMLMLVNPVLNCLKWALGGKKRGDVTTRVIGVVDNICRVKRFVGAEEVEDGVLGELVKETYAMVKGKRFKVVRELVELCVLTLVRAFLGGGKGKKDRKAVLHVFFDAVDVAGGKLKKRRKRKRGDGGIGTSRFVRLGVEVIGNSWGDGREAILERVNQIGGSGEWGEL